MNVRDTDVEIPSGATRIDIQAIVYSDAHSPDRISGYLGLQPTKTAGKDIRTAGSPSSAPVNLWILSSEANVASIGFSDHLDWMLSKLLPIQGRIADLRKTGATRIALTCVVWTIGGGEHLMLTGRQVENLVRLQLDLGFEFTNFGDEG